MKDNSFKIKEILKFCVGGGSAVLVDFLVYRLLDGYMSVLWAKGISYVAGAIVGFIINKLWTFESKKFKFSEIIKYIILYAFSSVVNTLVNKFVLYLFTSVVFAFLCATGTSTIINFLGQKFFVFRKSKDDSGAENRRA